MKINNILGFENVLDSYEVYSDGIICSDGYILKESDNGKGYKTVSLKIKGERKYKKAYVHRLVALAFIRPANGKNEVNHINEIKNDNNVKNLEWVSRKENNNHGTKNERMKDTISREIYIYDYKGNFIAKKRSVLEASREIEGFNVVKTVNSRNENFFVFDFKPALSDFEKINSKSRYKTVVMLDTKEKKETIFKTNREARRFFDNIVNVTDCIKYKRLFKERYYFKVLDYNTLIDSPNLQEVQLQEAEDKEPLR